jgi:hypothetical protein
VIAINNCFHDLFCVLSIFWLATTGCNKLKSRQRVARTSATLTKNMSDTVIIDIKLCFFNNKTDVLLELIDGLRGILFLDYILDVSALLTEYFLKSIEMLVAHILKGFVFVC